MNPEIPIPMYLVLVVHTHEFINLYPAIISFVENICLLITSTAYVYFALQTSFIIEASILNPDQATPMGAVCSRSIFFAI